MDSSQTTVRLLFVDEGSYHHEDVSVPTHALAKHERLIDCIREDAEVLKSIHVDVARLCSAYLPGEE